MEKNKLEKLKQEMDSFDKICQRVQDHINMEIKEDRKNRLSPKYANIDLADKKKIILPMNKKSFTPR